MFTDPTHLLFNQELEIAGTKSEIQLLLALSRYTTRGHLSDYSLYELYEGGVAERSQDHRTDFIRLVLEVMNSRPNDHYVQLNAVTCLDPLTDGPLAKRSTHLY